MTGTLALIRRICMLLVESTILVWMQLLAAMHLSQQAMQTSISTPVAAIQKHRPRVQQKSVLACSRSDLGSQVSYISKVLSKENQIGPLLSLLFGKLTFNLGNSYEHERSRVRVKTKLK